MIRGLHKPFEKWQFGDMWMKSRELKLTKGVAALSAFGLNNYELNNKWHRSWNKEYTSGNNRTMERLKTGTLECTYVGIPSVSMTECWSM